MAKVFCQALKRIDGPVTRQSVVDALYDLKDWDIGLETQSSFASNTSAVGNKVWLSKLENGSFRSFEWRDFELPQ